MRDKPLNEKEMLFCTYYSVTQNAVEATVKAGYCTSPERSAARLMKRENIKAYISELTNENKSTCDEVTAGLRRLAFGCVSDAVKLAFSDNVDTEEIEKLDLFGISEIKVSKGKCVEIKFFDRLKALEKLGNMAANSADEGDVSFFRAIEKGALALRGCDRDE